MRQILLLSVAILILASCIGKEIIVEKQAIKEMSISTRIPELIDSTDFSIHNESFFFSDSSRRKCKAEIQSGYLRAELSEGNASLVRTINPKLDTAFLCMIINIQALYAGSRIFIGFTQSTTALGVIVKSSSDSLFIECSYGVESWHIKSIPIAYGLQQWIPLFILKEPDKLEIKVPINGNSNSFALSSVTEEIEISEVRVSCLSGNSLIYIDDVRLYK